MRRERGQFKRSPRSRWLKGPLQQPAKVELAFMLPGFRFLFAAIILSMSILVFGLGAAALLRAAHEEFASAPAWRGTPETVFAQQNEATRPVLALLRVDTPLEQQPVEQKASDNVPALAAPAVIALAPAEPERTAALKPEDSAPPEAAKPEIAVAQTSPQVAAAPIQADGTASAENMKIVAALPSANEAVPVASEPTSAPVSPDAKMASTKIATLGGPAVMIEPPAASEKPDRSAIKKRLRAQRAKERRRIAQRARLARQAPLQQPADGFAQPAAATIRTR
jgi:hypothetical protein